MTSTGGKPIGYQKPLLMGGHAGAVVSTIAVTSFGKTAGLSMAYSYGYIGLGALAGAFCCVTSAAIHNKLCISQSNDYQMLQGDTPLIADNLAYPSTQVITQQPSEVPTPPFQNRSGTELDPPPPYSEDRCLPPPYSDVAQTEPPPTYSEVIEQRGIATT